MFIKILFFLAKFAPFRVFQAFGSFLGFLMVFSNSKSLKTSSTNLKHVFKSKTKEEIDYLSRNSVRQTSLSLMEAIYVWSNSRDFSRKIYPLISKVNNESKFDSLLGEGKGLIIISSHIGNMELLISWMAHKAENLIIPFTKVKNKTVNNLIRSGRQNYGAKMVGIGFKSTKLLLEHINNKGTIAMAVDQVPKNKNRHTANFFGNACYTNSLISNIAKRTDCNVIYCSCTLGKDGYQINIREVGKNFFSDDVSKSLESMNKVLEEDILASPEQYAWEYKRFKGYIDYV
jgi:KDO2-lipid IV(A) lauroyltransferase